MRKEKGELCSRMWTDLSRVEISKQSLDDILKVFTFPSWRFLPGGKSREETKIP